MTPAVPAVDERTARTQAELREMLHRAAVDDARIVLGRARVPAPFLPRLPEEPSPDGTVLVDIRIEAGRIAGVTPACDPAEPGWIDLAGRHVWPLLIDVHAHLDKAHIVGRAPDSGGTHAGARAATAEDRVAHWRSDDLLRRMAFGLECADAHGVAAIRSHLDSHEGQAETSWRVFATLREAFKARIRLQAVALVPIDVYASAHARALADLVATHRGLLGGVTRPSGGSHGAALGDLDGHLDRLFGLAAERDLDIDLHVDEAADTHCLENVARATIRHGYEGRVTCGHCCSLSRLDAHALRARIALIADAGLSIVTLPTVNMYLQDRAPGRTPRWRGVAPVAELRQAGIPVAVAGDNCRDPFHAYGDHDMLDTWRQAVRVLHLDHPWADATALAGPVPADIMKLSCGRLRTGGPANLMILDAWTLDQVVARPQTDRLILRAGALQGNRVPYYATL